MGIAFLQVIAWLSYPVSDEEFVEKIVVCHGTGEKYIGVLI